MNNFRLILSAAAAVLLAVVSSPLLTELRRHHVTELWLSGGEVADLVVTNGTIYTSNAAFPFADSMAIARGRILRLGNYSSLQDLAGPKTRTLNLNKKLVVPGFIDSHVHLIFGGLQMARVQLRGISRKDQFVNKIKEALSSLPVKNEWAVGTWVWPTL